MNFMIIWLGFNGGILKYKCFQFFSGVGGGGRGKANLLTNF